MLYEQIELASWHLSRNTHWTAFSIRHTHCLRTPWLRETINFWQSLKQTLSARKRGLALIPLPFILDLMTFKTTVHFNFIFINRKMPSIYHENCGKPGPRSINYIPPPEARIFKSRSAPNSPLLGERRPLFPRASPRLTRGLNQLSDKTVGSKPTKSAKVGRSKSFHGKGMYLYNYRTFIFTAVSNYIITFHVINRLLLFVKISVQCS